MLLTFATDDIKTAVLLQNCPDEEQGSLTSAVLCALSRVIVRFTVALKLNLARTAGKETFQYIAPFWYIWWCFHYGLQNALVAWLNKSQLLTFYGQQMLDGSSHKNYKSFVLNVQTEVQ